MTFKKLSQQLHLWGGVVFGLLIVLLCLTGTVLLFEQEVSEWQNKEKLHIAVPAQATKLKLSVIIKGVQQQLQDTETLTALQYSPQDDVTLLLQTQHKEQIAVNPYTGEIVGRIKASPFFEKVRALHRYLLLPYNNDGTNTGRTIVGFSTLFFALVLISGIVMWWPKTTRGLGKRLKIKTNRGLHRFSIDFHQTAGLAASGVLLVLCLTGLTWSFPQTVDSLLALVGVEHTAPSQTIVWHKDSQAPQKTTAGNTSQISPEVWEKVLTEIQAKGVYTKIVLQHRTATAYLHHWGNVYANDSYTFSPTTGALLTCAPYEGQNSYTQMRAWITALHTATWGNLPTKLFALLALLVGMALPITGYYLWWKRSQQRKSNQKRKQAKNIAKP